MTRTRISDEWLSSCDFKWRQSERQPNKHWSLKLNVEEEGGRTYSQVTIEVQRNGWENQCGKYIGDPESWMLWVKDTFDRSAFLGNIRWQDEITRLAEIITHRPWNPETHIYGQAWPENSSVLKERNST
jgi:hypothetical protein